jgi:hypothetical protein
LGRAVYQLLVLLRYDSDGFLRFYTRGLVRGCRYWGSGNGRRVHRRRRSTTRAGLNKWLIEVVLGKEFFQTLIYILRRGSGRPGRLCERTTTSIPCSPGSGATLNDFLRQSRPVGGRNWRNCGNWRSSESGMLHVIVTYLVLLLRSSDLNFEWRS